MSFRAFYVRALLGCLPTVLLAACASVAPGDDDEPLPVGEWELVTSNFIESGRLPGVPRATLAIADGRLSAFSGCNRGSAVVRAVRGRLAVEPFDIARRACSEPVGTFDERYFALLRDTPVYQVDDGRLRLVAGDYNARFKKR